MCLCVCFIFPYSPFPPVYVFKNQNLYRIASKIESPVSKNAVAMVTWALNRISQRRSPQVVEMETMTLSQQFHDIQTRQTERYKTRVTKLHSNSPQPFDSAADMPSDDLGLMTETQKKEKSILVPSHVHGGNNTPVDDERVKSLRHQVKQLQSEKADLSSQLRTAEKKVASLQKTLQEEHDALGNGVATTQKIVELSKKNRILHAELTAERNRSRQMEKEIKKALSVEQVYVQEIRVHENEANSTETGQNLQLQLTALQEQLAQCRHKVTDYRNQCQLLKQDLKVAHRVIDKEVGPGMSVGALLNSPSGWRGRSQQIITLQNKLFEMKNLLEKTLSNNETKLEYVCRSGEGDRRVEARQKTVLEKMERERKQNLETTRKELERMQSECIQAHRECRALRARNKTLTEEMKLLKSEGPSIKRNSAMQNGNDHTNTHTLELRIHKLEKANHLLKQQLQESKCLRPSTRTEVVSLPSLHKPPPSQARAKSFPIREPLSAQQQQTASGEKYTLREAQVLVQMAEHERDRLLDLTLTLQQRLDNTTDQLMRLKLEKSVGQKLPRFAPSGTKHGMKQKHRLDEQVEALEAEIAIQRDENTVLRETLRQMRQEKLEDMRKFHDTLQDTRKMCVGRHLEIDIHWQ